MIHTIQIDVKELPEDPRTNAVVCNLYTGQRCIRILMHESDYKFLLADGFFIRDGKTKDSAGVINTTNDFKEVK